VQLADGTSTKALVPQIYAMVRAGDLLPTGALLGGNSVDIQSSGKVSNSGTILGRGVVNIQANTIDNLAGTMAAQALLLKTKKNADGTGGSLITDKVIVLDIAFWVGQKTVVKLHF
jgi:filamentous hemagglutinin